jgi:RNA polymerase sigma-70 factor (ECF subfamily)
MGNGMKEPEMRQLAVKAGGGDMDAANDLIRAIHGRLMGYLFLLGVTSTDIDDIGQEVALKIYRSLGRYDGSRPFLPWMKTIARRTVANYWRSTSRRERHMAIFRRYVSEHVAQEESDRELLDPLLDRVHECVERLQEQHKRLVRLRYYEDLRSPEIARRVNLKAQTVRNLLSKIRDILQRCVDPRGSMLEGEEL